MASVNKVTILGNVGKDPELRFMPNGEAACNITVATSRQWKDKTSGEKQEETEGHRISFFGRLAEIAGEYVKKGHPIYVEGRLKTRKYADKEGVEKYATEIIASDLQLLSKREDAPQRQTSSPPPKQARQKAAQFDDSDVPF